jgi:hypothetical protein
MFNLTSNHPAVTTGKFKSLAIESDNTAINFEEGYLNNDEFVSMGVNHCTLHDTPEKTETVEGEEVVTPAVTDHTDFINLLSAAEDKTAAIETFLEARYAN